MRLHAPKSHINVLRSSDPDTEVPLSLEQEPYRGDITQCILHRGNFAYFFPLLFFLPLPHSHSLPHLLSNFFPLSFSLHPLSFSLLPLSFSLLPSFLLPSPFIRFPSPLSLHPLSFSLLPLSSFPQPSPSSPIFSKSPFFTPVPDYKIK